MAKSNSEICKTYYKKNKEREKLRVIKWQKENPERFLAYIKDRAKKKFHIVLEHYGNKCECCGEDEPLFLCVDHINRDGAAHRKTVGAGVQIYSWLIRNNFPQGFRLLCYNCNSGRERNNGICPHKTPLPSTFSVYLG